MTIGTNEIELLRTELAESIMATVLWWDVAPRPEDIKRAIEVSTQGWTAYRVRARNNDDGVEERWQVRSSWRNVVPDGVQGTITGRLTTKRPMIQDAGPSQRRNRSK